jgi:hypothetical protein
MEPLVLSVREVLLVAVAVVVLSLALSFLQPSCSVFLIVLLAAVWLYLGRVVTRVVDLETSLATRVDSINLLRSIVDRQRAEKENSLDAYTFLIRERDTLKRQCRDLRYAVEEGRSAVQSARKACAGLTKDNTQLAAKLVEARAQTRAALRPDTLPPRLHDLFYGVK